MFQCKCLGLFFLVGYTKKLINGYLFFFLIWYFKSILLYYLFDAMTCTLLLLMHWKQSVLRSSITEGSSIDPFTDDGPSNDVTNDFLVPGCNCKYAAGEKLADAVWFFKIV